MQLQEYLLGFDSRRLISNIHEWSEQRRDQYLLRTNVRFPLSVDEIVWDPVSHVYPEFVVPAENIFHANLWVNLDILNEALSFLQAGNNAMYSIIALTLAVNSMDMMKEWLLLHGMEHDQINLFDRERHPEWMKLGYDVVDAYGLSGMMNCGYTEEDKTELREFQQKNLNEHHLFNDAHEADSFRIYTNKRVVEHAPFYVMGIYLVESKEGPLNVER
jgi:hypothetical protein